MRAFSAPAFLYRLARDRTGATAIEYGLLVAFIGMAIMVALGGVGNQLKATFTGINTTFATANAAG